MPSNSDPKMRKALRVLLLLVAVCVITSVVVVATHKNATTPTGTPVTDATTTTAAAGETTTTAGDTTTTAAVGTKSAVSGDKTTTTAASTSELQSTYVLFSINGSGDDTIGRFLVSTLATHWDVKWSYDCSKLKRKGIFSYKVVFIKGTHPDPDDLGPREAGMTGSGVARYKDDGIFGIRVTSQCSWSVRVSEGS